MCCCHKLPLRMSGNSGIGSVGDIRMDEEEVKSIADNCNTKKLNSKRVEVSCHINYVIIIIRVLQVWVISITNNIC